MRQEVQIELVRRALRLIEQREFDMDDATSSVAVDTYASAERLAREREVLFRELPILVGYSSQLERPGDFLTHDHTGTSVLVTRDREGRLRGFLNACRHRGAHVTRQACGRGKHHFTCPFHGWTYGSDGGLEGLPHPVGFPELDKDRFGLVPVPVAERYGLVFAVPSPGEHVDIDAFLGPLLTDLEGFGFQDYMMIRPSTRTRRMNWKLHMDATNEIYHLGFLHETTAGAGFFTNLSLLDFVEPHTRLVLPQPTIQDMAQQEPESWRLCDHAGVVYGIFPNTTILIDRGIAQVLSTFPVDTDTAVLHGGMLVPKGPVTDEVAFQRKGLYEKYWETMEEDMQVCESMQQNMRSGANELMLFGRYENNLGKYHGAIESALQGRLRF